MDQEVKPFSLDEMFDDEEIQVEVVSDDKPVTDDKTIPEDDKTTVQDTTTTVVDDDVKPDASGMVPHQALHAEREKRKAVEVELARLKAEKTTTPAPAQPQPAQTVEDEIEEEIPDVVKDPEGWARYVQQQTELRVLNTKLDVSERFAREKHGDEKVNNALDWMEKELITKYPETYQRILAQKDPYASLLELHDNVMQQETLKGLNPDDLEAFKAWQAAQLAIKNGEQTTSTPSGKTGDKPKPPKSLATATSDGMAPKPGDQTVEPGAAFKSVFN